MRGGREVENFWRRSDNVLDKTFPPPSEPFLRPFLRTFPRSGKEHQKSCQWQRRKASSGGEERAAASLNEKSTPATMPSKEMSPMASRIATFWLSRVRVFFRIRHVRMIRGISPAEGESKKVANALGLEACRQHSARSRNRVGKPRNPRKHLASPKPKPRDSPRDIGHVNHYGRNFPSRAGKKRGVGPQEDGGDSAEDKKKKK